MAQDIAFRMEFARGDSYQRGLMLKIGDDPCTDTFDDVYFTVKRYYMDTDYIFQKRMSQGWIEKDPEDGHYTITIDPSDTDGLAFGDYDCDLEFVSSADSFKRTFYGKLKLTREVTHVNNE